AAHFGKPPRKGVHPDECVALGAALLADSLDNIDAVTLLDALSMPIGLAQPNGRFRPVIDKHTVLPVVKRMRIPLPRDPADREIVLDIFQGDSEEIVDNEFLGSVRFPATWAGRKLDFILNEECLLTLKVEDGSQMRPLELATRDTPESLKRALAALREKALSTAPQQAAGAEGGRGLFSSIKSLFGR